MFEYDLNTKLDSTFPSRIEAMDEKIRKSILNHITGFTKEAVEQIKSDIKPVGDVLVFADRGISLYATLPSAFYRAQGQIVTKLHQNAQWYKKYSEHFLEGLIQELIINLIEKDDCDGSLIYQDAQFQLDKLEKDFDDYSERQTVYIPLYGIQIEKDAQTKDELSIGNIKIATCDEAKVNATLMDLEPFASIFRETILERGKDKAVLAIYRTPPNEPAEPERARERALGEVRRVFDVLRYAITFLAEEPSTKYVQTKRKLPTGLQDDGTIVGSPYPINIGLEGEICRDRSIHLVKSHSRFFMTRGETKSDLVFSSENIEKMKKNKVFDVSDVLKRSYTYINDLTAYEDMMLRGIHWIANATNQVERENEILSLFTCLECYFSSKQHSPAGSIADGVTEIISDLNDKKLLNGSKSKLWSWVRHQYEMRGEITHGGTFVTTDVDLATLRDIAKKVTRWIIEQKEQFKTKEELCLWIQCQKLDCAGRKISAKSLKN